MNQRYRHNCISNARRDESRRHKTRETYTEKGESIPMECVFSKFKIPTECPDGTHCSLLPFAKPNLFINRLIVGMATHANLLKFVHFYSLFICDMNGFNSYFRRRGYHVTSICRLNDIRGKRKNNAHCLCADGKQTINISISKRIKLQ